jgi:hypothetical protein
MKIAITSHTGFYDAQDEHDFTGEGFVIKPIDNTSEEWAEGCITGVSELMTILSSELMFIAIDDNEIDDFVGISEELATTLTGTAFSDIEIIDCRNKNAKETVSILLAQEKTQ